MSGRQLLRGFGRFVEQLLAPGVCLGCGCDPPAIPACCVAVAENACEAVPNPCQHCGQPNPVNGIVCPACPLNPPRWQKLIAPLQYRGITRDYLLQLKHTQATHLAKALCRHSVNHGVSRIPAKAHRCCCRCHCILRACASAATTRPVKLRASGRATSTSQSINGRSSREFAPHRCNRA